MQERKRIFYLILVMVAVALTAAGIAILMLYNTAFNEQRERLIETAKSRARIIEAIARYNTLNNNTEPEGPASATMSQVIEAHENFEGFGRTGEFVLAKRVDDEIVFLLSHRHHDLDQPKPVPFASTLAEPMRLALSGASGSIVGLDYRGELVLAAHEPVDVLDYGIVAKIDLTEVRQPFINASLVAAGVAIIVLMGGAVLFMRITDPIIRRLREHSEQLEKEVSERTSDLEEANRMLSLAREELSGRVEERTTELLKVNAALKSENAERRQAEDELHRYRQRLEHMVEERTRELKAANLRLQHEITERMRMEDELMRVQKLDSLGVFAGGIAHDFNNLLQMIINCIGVAKMHASAQGPLLDLLKDAETASKYASNLSYRLLTFAKGGEPITKVTSITSILEESISLSLSGSDIVCETEIPDDLPPVEVDAGQINQVFSNLLINAKEAMHGGGAITVRATNTTIEEDESPFPGKGDYVKISVQDQGAGIEERNLNKIFDPYFSTKERGAEKGTGLGLSICHSIIKKHDGFITVESKAGSGTTFHVFLPVSDKPLVKDEVKETVPDHKGGRVLLMEDEKNMWLSTRLIFNAMGYEVEFAMNGSEAVSLYENAVDVGRPFEIVMLDLTIPGGMGGKETIGRLRDIDKNVKAIVISGYTDDPVMTHFRDFGFVSALAKPYTIDQLKDSLHDAFEQ